MTLSNEASAVPSSVIGDDFPKGEVPPRHHAHGVRQPNLLVSLCAGCAGFAPFTDTDYSGALSGCCNGCGRRTRELHRFRAAINSAAGCTCATHGDPVHGDLHAQLTDHHYAPGPPPRRSQPPAVNSAVPTPTNGSPASPGSTWTDDGHVIARGSNVVVRFECTRPDDCRMKALCEDCGGRGHHADNHDSPCNLCGTAGIQQPPVCWITEYADWLDALQRDLDERRDRTGDDLPPPGRYALQWYASGAGPDREFVARFGPLLTTAPVIPDQALSATHRTEPPDE